MALDCRERDGDGKTHRCIRRAFESGDCTIHTNEAGEVLGPCHCLDQVAAPSMTQQQNMRPDHISAKAAAAAFQSYFNVVTGDTVFVKPPRTNPPEPPARPPAMPVRPIGPTGRKFRFED